MDTTDKISLFLGAVSVLLAIYAVYQSWNYRKLDEKIDNDREQDMDKRWRNMDEKKNHQAWRYLLCPA